jgi:hypothetical protein
MFGFVHPLFKSEKHVSKSSKFLSKAPCTYLAHLLHVATLCIAWHHMQKNMQLFKTNQGTYLNNLMTHNRISHPGKLMRTVCHFSASLLKRTPQKKFNAFILTILLAVHTIISTSSHKAISQDHVYVYFLQ